MSNRRRLFLSLGVFAVVIASALFLWFWRTPAGNPSNHVRGPLNALVVLTLYADPDDEESLEATRALLKLSETFPLDLRVEYRYLPQSLLGVRVAKNALVLECAIFSGKFWSTLAALVNSEAKLLVPRAAERSLASAPPASCPPTRELRATVAADEREARSRGLKRAPTLLVDGVRFNDQLTIATLQQRVTERLGARDTSQYLPIMGASDLWEQLNSPRPPVILDVRSPEEFVKGHIQGVQLLSIPAASVEPEALAQALTPFLGSLLVVVDSGSAAEQRIAFLLRALGHSVFRFEGMGEAAKIPGLLAS